MPAPKKPKMVKENSERWLLTYSDLITLLLIFFIILYSISSTDLRKFQDLTGAMHQAFNNGQFQVITIGGSLGNPKNAVGTTGLEQSKKDLAKKIQRELTKVARELGIPQNVLHVDIRKEGIVITLAGGLLFYPGDTELRPQYTLLLSRIAMLLKGLPNPIRVRGYTDAQLEQNSIYQTNWELSSLRAVSIVEQLINNDGLAPQRLNAEGYAQYHPTATNKTHSGRAENRRAEIVIVYGS